MMQLTQDFAEITDKARQHFTTGEDSIIDDHVIGASPARRLMFNSLPHRHSTDDSLLGAAITQKPQRSITGWTAPAPPDPALSSSSHSPRKAPSNVQQRTAPSQLSLELNTAAVASQSEAEPLRSHKSSGNLMERTGFGKTPNSSARTRTASPIAAAPKPRAAARRLNSLDSLSCRPSWVRDPDFWVSNKAASGDESSELAVLKSLHGCVEAAVTDLHVIADKIPASGNMFLSAAAGFAAGVALTLVLVNR